jgi:hypothetical protein
MTTKMSRRSILARTAAGAAVAALPVAKGQAQACEDPIFAMIDLNRRAMIECVTANSHFDQYRNERIEFTGLPIENYLDDRDTRPEPPLIAKTWRPSHSDFRNWSERLGSKKKH